MPVQTTTRYTEAELEPAAILKILSEPAHIPEWAPVFADNIEVIGNTNGDTHCRVTKNGESFDFIATRNEAAGTVDYVRDMANGRRGGAYIRVTPRPVGGSAITMTVPVGPNTTADEVGKTVEDELRALIGLAEATA